MLNVSVLVIIFIPGIFSSLVILTPEPKLQCHNNLYSIDDDKSIPSIDLLYSSTNLEELLYASDYGSVCGNPRIMVDFRLSGKEYFEPETFEFTVVAWYLDTGKKLLNATSATAVVVPKIVVNKFFAPLCGKRSSDTPLFISDSVCV